MKDTNNYEMMNCLFDTTKINLRIGFIIKHYKIVINKSTNYDISHKVKSLDILKYFIRIKTSAQSNTVRFFKTYSSHQHLLMRPTKKAEP